LTGGALYAAAGTVAARVQTHFVEHLTAERARGHDRLAVAPEADAIEAIVDAAFWASLRREEGYVPRISLAFVAPEQAGHALRFADPLPLDPGALTHLAPAVERPGIHLGVWRGSDGRLSVWGATRSIPTLCFVLEVVRPGLLVIKHRRSTVATKYVNVAVLDGDQVKVLDPARAAISDCPEMLSSLLGFDSASAEAINVLIELAVSMRAHGRGGTLLVVQPDTRSWIDSIVQPISYVVTPPFLVLAELMDKNADVRTEPEWQEGLRRAVDAIGGLTAVDGATILSHRYDVMAFGAKIVRRKGSAVVDHVTLSEPIEGNVPRIVNPAEIGGTRHLSAAQFVLDQHDATAYVASQDGRFTIFAWSSCEEMVHARRVETLLL
jgi:hypothetical protein